MMTLEKFAFGYDLLANELVVLMNEWKEPMAGQKLKQGYHCLGNKWVLSSCHIDIIAGLGLGILLSILAACLPVDLTC